ncbi:conserved hypothetical protein [Leishmania braziliensis MHOM/BR/75/M2904]|uniref:Uncharacterized protein n=2 Tax=Leishmania braziliensis TaxID=5660 RepID=A4HAF5_LEIBR|nr:conserved hypothetical protein [Leishmania braziliensis MHOM/BR/75/M2904]CAJ2471019.1 unnamed protein product [Leishmania braziliensis]CAM38384.1 conserved hypothetical protein [Leishmania braziliensis MHOM/BR/75/M2904]SYZ65011.1 hypothetical_protein [Leishmania braziliensis MHOM/BR/75/M2904]
MLTQPSDELERLRKELAREENDLAALEDNVESQSAQLGYLHTEYTINKTRIYHHYEPTLAPLRVVTYAAAQRQSLIELQIEWLERKVVEQERRSQGGQYIEIRDMKPAAEEYLRKAHQSLLRCYEHISECPEEPLHIISQYACPPEEAIATMELVMKVRGEASDSCTWKASQVLLSYTYFHEFFAMRSESLLKRCDLLPNELMSELERFCADPHHSVCSLYRISTPIGCMGEWLHAIRNYYRVKLVTAPVLLSRNADTRRITEQAQAWLSMITLSEEEGDQRQRQREQQTTVAKDASTDNAELGALVSAGEAGRESLLLPTKSASVTADTVQKLRHQLHKLRESVRAAEAERTAIEGLLQEKLAEVRGNYDETMVPLEDQLEEMTECFGQRLTRKGDVAAASPLSAATAANTTDNAAVAVAATL